MENRKNKDSFKPNIVVLYCQHCIAEKTEIKPEQNAVSGFKARFLMMPCSSKVEASHMLKILAEGADGVQVVGCMEKHCRFLVGNLMVEKRIEYARHLLDEIRMGSNRLGMDRGDRLSSSQLLGIAEKRAEAVRPLGPSPMKEAVAS